MEVMKSVKETLIVTMINILLLGEKLGDALWKIPPTTEQVINTLFIT